MTEKEILQELRNWDVLLSDIASLRERMKSRGYKITPTYDQTGVMGGGACNSKVERYFWSKYEDEMKLRQLCERKEKIRSLIGESGLSKMEKALVSHIMHGGSLSSFARKNGLYKSSVYKIRDKAVSKMAARTGSGE